MKSKLSSKRGILLDIGAGETRRRGFVTLDKRRLAGIDIVHDLEKFPYPIDDNICLTIVASHVVEHIKPWLMIDFFNELWRIAKLDGQLAISMPYGYSDGFLQDPTHCNMCNYATWQYFDPRFPLYNVYKPRPWQIERGFPQWQESGNMEVLLTKIKKAK
ncbi:MAG: class I SAM-dependent methyltransferase [Desulfobacterales bacterium]